jgi:hypothetical protein
MIDLVPARELARKMGYAGPNDAFRQWCRKIGIAAVPGRRGVYDPVLVRRRLDEAQGLIDAPPKPDSLVAQRRARLGKH